MKYMTDLTYKVGVEPTCEKLFLSSIGLRHKQVPKKTEETKILGREQIKSVLKASTVHHCSNVCPGKKFKRSMPLTDTISPFAVL